MRWLLLTAVLFCLLSTRSYAAPAAPAAVSLRWISATTAILSWEQQSDATWVCVNGWDGYNIGIFRQCEETGEGPHMMILMPESAAPLQYYDIVEWAGPPDARVFYGNYQSYPLYRERVLLPLIEVP